MLGRRELLKLGAGTLLATELPELSFAMRDPLKPLALNRLKIVVGASKPFVAIQVSDTHIARAVASDGKRKAVLAAARSFSVWGAYYLDEAVRLAKKRGDLLLHTGDLMDFVSDGNLEQAEGRFAGNDWIVSAGNHEFSKFVGEARENEAYKRDSYDRVQDSYPNDLTFYSRVVNGVNFVSLDDVYYNFTERQLELFRKEVEKGLPIVMLCHVPLYVPNLYASVMDETEGRCAYVVGAPDGLVDKYEPGVTYPAGEEWRYRKNQQRADAPTKAMIVWLKEQPLLKAILCGHLHRTFAERFSATAMQYVCGATYKGDANLIEFI